MCNALRRKLETVPIDDISKISGLKTYDKYVVEWKDRIILEKKCPAPVRGAVRYNHLIYQKGLQNKYAYLKNGMKCKMYYDKQGNPFAYHDESFPHEIAPPISREIQLEKLIFSPVKRLVSGGMIEGSLSNMGTGKNLPSFKNMFKKK
ncbi:DNA polymerase [Tenacibaculum phage PTm5]|nr:DNA polymerase [Tenacibaculum phage PTm5]